MQNEFREVTNSSGGTMHTFLLAFLLSFPSCTPKGPPCWLTGPCDPYQVEKWIVGVGSGVSQAEADKIAISNIALQFGVDPELVDPELESDFSKSQETALSEQGVKGSDEDIQRQKERALQIAEDRAFSDISIAMNNVKIVERHQKGRAFFTLAVLARSPLLNLIDERLSNIDTELGQRVFEAKEMESKVDSIRRYGTALELVRSAEKLNEKRMVVDPTFQKRPLVITEQDIRDRQENIFRSMTISSDSDTGSKELQDFVSNSFAKHLFRLVDMDGEIKLQLKSKEAIIPAEAYGYHKVRIKIELLLTEPALNNRLLMQQELIGEASSENIYKARALAVQELQKMVTGGSDIGLRLRQSILSEEQ